MLINGPAVVGRRRVCARILNVLRRLDGALLVRIRTNVLPIIRRHGTVFRARICLVLADPVIRVAKDLASAVVTRNGSGLENDRYLTDLRLVVEDM